MREIQLTKGQVAQVDDVDFDYLSQWSWSAQKCGTKYYAVRTIHTQGRPNRKVATIYMHRLLMGLVDPKILCDHKNNDGLDNQRSNMRIATRSDNNSNTSSRPNSSSKYLGVYWNTQLKKWCADIRKNKKCNHLGSFHSEVDAALAYNRAAVVIHGEFAKLNIPPKE